MTARAHMLSNYFPSDETLMAVGATLGAVLSFAFGDVSKLMLWLGVFVVIDFCTGLFCACMNGEWTSRIMRKGISAKLMIFVMVALAHGLDFVFHAVLPFAIFQYATICAYCLSEFGSIIENVEKMGLGSAIPQTLRRMLAAASHRLDHEIEKIEDSNK